MLSHYRRAHDESGVQRRDYELRFDPEERRVSGTAMKYGDVATMPWGDKERFEPGAFGEVAGLDVLLNVQHDRSLPIARTLGGSMRITDTGGELRIEADLPDTTIANDAVVNIREGILRGLSIEFIPDETAMDGDTLVVKKATLRGVGVVDRPAYKKSKVLPRSEVEMNEAEIKALIERAIAEALSTRSDPTAPVDATAIATAVSGAIGATLADMPTAESVRAEIDAAIKAREEAEEARAKAEDEKAAMKKKAKDDEDEMQKKSDDRADLLLTVKPLLPEGTESRGKSNHELLVLAVGDEVTDAANRSEDYLLAKVETITERRAAAAAGNPVPAKPGVPASNANPINMTRFIEQRNQARRVSA